MDLFEGLDWGTYYFFRFHANSAPGLYELMRIGNWLGGYLAAAFILALAVVVMPRQGRWRMALVTVAAFLIGAMLVEGVKRIAPRQRPPDAENTLGTVALASGFPSRHVYL